jgi:hypothetical protein
MRGPPSFAILVLAALGLASGCGPTFDGTVYRGKGFAFRVPERPAGWRPIGAEGTALAFRDVDGGATIAVNGRCGKDAEDVPLAALTQHLFIQFTDREASTEEVVPFDGREALHTVMTAKLDGVPKKFDVWVLKKDGCVYDLYLIAAPDRFEASASEFRKFVGGFATVPGDG